MAGVFRSEAAKRPIDEKDGLGLVAFGAMVYFECKSNSATSPRAIVSHMAILQPDLRMRIREGINLMPYSRYSFYTTESPQGYIDCRSISGHGSNAIDTPRSGL